MYELKPNNKYLIKLDLCIKKLNSYHSTKTEAGKKLKVNNATGHFINANKVAAFLLFDMIIIKLSLKYNTAIT